MWPSPWHPIGWTLTGIIILILFFTTFWSNYIRFPFWSICRGPWHGPWKLCLIVYTVYIPSLLFSDFIIRNTHISFFGNIHWTLTTAPNKTDHHPYFFYDFSNILWLFFIWKHKSFHIWKYTLDPEHNNPQHHYQQSLTTIPYFFLIFPLFYCYFSFSTALLSIFGNVHWTLKRTVSTIPLFFSWFFPIWLLFFIWHSLVFHIWKYTLDPENNPPPNIATNHPDHHPYFFLIFPLFYCHFSFGTAPVAIFGNVQWTLKTAGRTLNSVTQKYIFFSFFFWFFLIFFSFFSLFLDHFPDLERPWRVLF